MPKVKGSKKFVLDGKAFFAVEIKGLGWYRGKEDVTLDVGKAIDQAHGGESAYAGDESKAAVETAGQGVAAGVDAAVHAAEGGLKIIPEIEMTLKRLDSSVQTIKETLKGVEVALRSVSNTLHESEAQRELAVIEERKREKDRGLGKYERHRAPRSG